MRENRTYGLKRGANVILKLVATSLHQKQEVSLNDFDYYICFYSTGQKNFLRALGTMPFVIIIHP